MIQTTEFFTSTDLFPLWVECVNDILFPPSFEISSSNNSLDGNDNDDNEKHDNEDDDLYEEKKYDGEYYSDILPVFDLTEKTNETTTTTTKPDHYYYNEEHKKSKWTENAMLISSTMDDMTNYLRQNACAYVGNFEGISSFSPLAAASTASFEKMDSAESSEFEFMITSFTVSTANQIEQLRKTQTNAIMEETKNSSSNNNIDLQNHHAAILAILLNRLQEDVMKTMNELIKLRKLHNNENEDSERSDSDYEKEEEDGMEDNEEAHPLHNLAMFHNNESVNHQTSSSHHHLSNEEEEEEEDVLSNYEDEHSATNHLNNKETSNDTESTLNNSTQKILPYPKKEDPKKSKVKNQHNIINQDSSVMQQDENNPTSSTSQQTTQTQQILYEPQTQNLLEIQKIETNMIQITQLLQQFSSLVEAQTEQVEFIHEAAMDAKESMEKGTDQIVDATERKESSPHHMAKFIFSLGVLLLMMNSIMY